MLGLFWATFTILAIRGGRAPAALEAHPERHQFPAMEVAIIAVVFGAVTAWLERWWTLRVAWRLGRGLELLAFFAVLCVLFVAGDASDLPPELSAVSMFGLFSAVILVARLASNATRGTDVDASSFPAA